MDRMGFFGPHRETSALLPPNLIHDEEKRFSFNLSVSGPLSLSLPLSIAASAAICIPTQERSPGDTPHSDTHNFSIIKICCSPWLLHIRALLHAWHSFIFGFFPARLLTIRFFFHGRYLFLLLVCSLIRDATGDLTALFVCMCACACVSLSRTHAKENNQHMWAKMKSMFFFNAIPNNVCCRLTIFISIFFYFGTRRCSYL